MKRQPTCVCVNLRRLARTTTQLYDQALAASGIKVTQYSLLCAIEREQPVAISALAEEVELDRTTLARNLTPLERDGLIELRAVATDKRVTEVTLTRQGRAAIARARPQWERAQQQVSQKIGAERVRMLRVLAEELSRIE
jgi:DNA-binding MarR family transcriptional regulator